MLKVFIKLYMYEIMINLQNYQHEVLKLCRLSNSINLFME